jgi:hypothetical protein
MANLDMKPDRPKPKPLNPKLDSAMWLAHVAAPLHYAEIAHVSGGDIASNKKN